MKFKKYKNEVNKRYPNKLKLSNIRALYKKGIPLHSLLVEMRNETIRQNAAKNLKEKLEKLDEASKQHTT